jgi:hypothetical protein
VDYAGAVVAFLMASNCNAVDGCREIVMAPFHGPSGSEFCQISANHLNQSNAYTVVTGFNKPVVFVCKPNQTAKSSVPKTQL